MPNPEKTISAKTQRLVDLLAALLVRRYPASFEELARDVPAYSTGEKSDSALMRMFERDKDELRSFGVPIETVANPDGETSAYRLHPVDFYLPYLCLASERGSAEHRPRRVDRDGYRALPSLLFEPDEVKAIASAAARIRQLGNPGLSEEAESAMRKLAIDLPMVDRPGDDIKLLSREKKVEEKVFATLSDALLRGKVLTFRYYSMEADRSDERQVEPYGLFFLSSHWYLVGRDVPGGQLRNFRLSRLSSPTVSASRAHTRDFQVPPDFDLRQHAHSRQAWELGAGDQIEAIVRFTQRTGATGAALELGRPVPGEPDCRAFAVRRLDSFARWLLSFGGSAIPLSPPEILTAYRELLAATLGLYQEPEQQERSGRSSS